MGKLVIRMLDGGRDCCMCTKTCFLSSYAQSISPKIPCI